MISSKPLGNFTLFEIDHRKYLKDRFSKFGSVTQVFITADILHIGRVTRLYMKTNEWKVTIKGEKKDLYIDNMTLDQKLSLSNYLESLIEIARKLLADWKFEEDPLIDKVAVQISSDDDYSTIVSLHYIMKKYDIERSELQVSYETCVKEIVKKLKSFGYNADYTGQDLSCIYVTLYKQKFESLSTWSKFWKGDILRIVISVIIIIGIILAIIHICYVNEHSISH